MFVFQILQWNYIRKFDFVEQGFLVYIYHICIHSCFGCHCIVFLNTVTLFLSRETFVVVALQVSFSMSGEGREERVCILLAMYSITFVMFAFLICRCARCFHRTFSKVFFNFSGEAESSLSICLLFFGEFVSANSIKNLLQQDMEFDACSSSLFHKPLNFF